MPDTLVLTMYMMQTHHLQEFIRASKGVRKFAVKYDNRSKVCKLNITGIDCTSIDDLAAIVNVGVNDSSYLNYSLPVFTLFCPADLQASECVVAV